MQDFEKSEIVNRTFTRPLFDNDLEKPSMSVNYYLPNKLTKELNKDL